MFAIAFIILSVVSHHAEGYGSIVTEVNALKAQLLDGYNRNTSPRDTDHVHVNADFSIKAIGDLDERLEKLTTVLYVSIRWKDPSFTWNPANFSDVKRISMGREEVWVPEFFVLNQHHHIDYGIEEKRYTRFHLDAEVASAMFQKFLDKRQEAAVYILPVEYNNEGFARFNQLITAETSCDLDTSGFPFDQHTCTIEFTCNKNYVRLEAAFKDLVLIMFEPDGSWDVTDATIDDEDYFGLTINITLARKPTFVLVNLIVPMTLLALISPMVFLLPNQSGERVGFSITVLLATSVFMTIVADNVPAKSQPFPLILTLLFISYSLTVAVVVIVIINARIYRLPDTMSIPMPLIWLLKGARCLCCCFRRRNTHGKNDNEDGTIEEKLTIGEGELLEKRTSKNKIWTWKDVSWGIDMFFLTFLYTTKFTLVIVFMVILKSMGSASLKDPEPVYENN